MTVVFTERGILANVIYVGNGVQLQLKSKKYSSQDQSEAFYSIRLRKEECLTLLFYTQGYASFKRWFLALAQHVSVSYLPWYYSSLDEMIGRGSSSKVYSGEVMAQQCAVKVIDKCKLSEQDILQTRREIEISKSVDFPHIIKLYSYFENSRSIYLNFEKLQSQNLQDFLLRVKSALSVNQAKGIVYQIALAIGYLRSSHILHRDIKPHNILLTGSSIVRRGTRVPEVKLIDFGLSRIIGPDESANENFGTFNYAAPQIIMGQGHSYAADMFSLGVMLYEMVYQKLPFPDDDEKLQLLLKCEGEVEFEDTKALRETNKILRKLLHEKASKRMKIEDLLTSKWL